MKLHRCSGSTSIGHTRASKKIESVTLLRETITIRMRGYINTQEVLKWTEISHQEGLTQFLFYKCNVSRIITSKDHVIHIQKKNGSASRGGMYEHGWIMYTRSKTCSLNNCTKSLKPCTWSLFETIESTTKTTD
ncbi:hypothetical protein IHE45_19G176800 [Dioscorea alata]|uniref:Uncharacterized protein n=1 Tax=Dioscorea alata TaxID=55571 RepID=A0ACB7U3U8_DIOAL|nr:hypothetical protein IHE45_19G176800 [Dioscorea alata]